MNRFLTVSAPLPRPVLCSALALVLCAGIARADFTYDDFSDPSGLNLLQNAGVNGTDLRVTAAIEGQLGGAWYDQLQPIAGGFETVFRFRLSEAGGVQDFFGGFGADGLAFVIQNDGVFALGEGGSGMGYGTIPNSLAVEFDTWGHPFFEDPDGNHISVQSLGTEPNSYTANASLGLTSAIPELSDGSTHTARIAYDGATLSIFLDDMDTPVLQVSVDLSTLLSLDDGSAFVGFTASTGGAWENHDILNWSFGAGRDCYADCDANSKFDLFDFLCFVNAFNVQDDYADCDSNGVFDLFDFLCYVNAFNGSC